MCYEYRMHMPLPSPALRGLPLRIAAALAAFAPLRNLLVWKVRRDARIPELPRTP